MEEMIRVKCCNIKERFRKTIITIVLIQKTEDILRPMIDIFLLHSIPSILLSGSLLGFIVVPKYLTILLLKILIA